MPKQIRVLIVEDSEEDALLLVLKLEKGNIQPHWKRVDTQDKLISALDQGIWDLILCDYQLPGFSGFKALSIVKERNLDIPFIFVSATMGEDIAVEAMKMGAHDWILKQSLGRLLPAVDRELREADIRLKQKIIVESMRNLSLAVNQSPVSVVITNTKGEIEFVNPKFSELTGYRIDEVMGQNPRILKSGFTPHETFVDLWKNITSGKEWHGEFCNRKKNGDLYWEIASISPVYNSEGALTNYVAVKEDITEQKHKDDELRANEEKYRILFESESDAIFLIDSKTEKILEVNTAASTLYGYSHAELLEMKNSDLSDEPLKTLKAIKDKEKSVLCRWHRKKDGSIFPVEITASHFKWKDVPVFLIDIRDITERILAQKTIAESEERFRKIFEEGPIGISTSDSDFYFIRANAAFCKIMGYTEQELKSLTFKDLTHPDHVYEDLEKIRDLYRGDIKQYQTEKRYITKNKKTIWATITATIVRNTNGEFMNFLAMVDDITEQKLAEKNLSILNERYNLAVKAAGLGVWDRDVQKNELIWDDMMYKIYGLQKTAFAGVYEAWLKCLHPDDIERCNQEIKQALLGEKIYDTEFRIILPNGSVKYIKAFGHVIRDHSGKPIRMTGINYEITARKKAEEELKHSREQLKKFAAHLQNIREEERVLLAREIHDELGQILTAIKIDMGLMKQKISKGLELTTTDELLDEINHLFGLVDKTIKTTRKIMTELRPEVLDALGFVDALKSHANEFQERHQIDCQVESTISKLEINSQQSVALFRIFQEALTNVAKHSKATEVKIHLKRINNRLVLEIIDNGIGFDEQHKVKTDSYGLIGMRERVFLLEGDLFISGQQGKGTTIKVEIPYVK